MNNLRLKQYSSINGREGDSFAAFTIKQRFPAIIQKLIEDNNYTNTVNTALEKLGHQVNSAIFFQRINSGSDHAQWNAWIAPYERKSWFEVPFYFAEACFYRLILDITGYFEHGQDPFLIQKMQDIEVNKEIMVNMLNEIERFISDGPTTHQLLNKLLFKSLWGNKSDLSQLSLDREKNDLENNTFINDESRTALLFNAPIDRIDIVLDNSGVELFTDILMAEQLIDSGMAHSVVLHAKPHPTFVSDATENDVRNAIEILGEMDSEPTKRMKKSLESMQKKNRIVIKAHEFWYSPLHFYEMPGDLRSELENSKFIIFKGDANYRRVFGDRHLPSVLEPGSLAYYLPSRSLAIRILKSEIIVGMESASYEKMNALDKNWLINGKYGIIQMLN